MLCSPDQPIRDLIWLPPASQCTGHTLPSLNTYLRGERLVEREGGREGDVTSRRPQPQAHLRSSVILCKVPLAMQRSRPPTLHGLEKIICNLFPAPGAVRYSAGTMSYEAIYLLGSF